MADPTPAPTPTSAQAGVTADASATETVGEIVARDYRTAAVFEKHHIDFCCGGAVTLERACREHRVDPAAIARELAAATSRRRSAPTRTPQPGR